MTRPLPGKGCPVTVWPSRKNLHSRRCGEPLADGADLCDDHEAARIRLTVGAPT